MEYASKGVAGSGLGLGIAGTALGLLNGGLLNGGALLGGAACNEDHCVNRYEASQAARIAELETEVKLRDANTFTMGEMGKLRDYVDSKFSVVEQQICQQAVYNATNNGIISCMQGQIAQLNALTKVVVPADNVCPQPMAMYNSWTAPTTTTTGA